MKFLLLQVIKCWKYIQRSIFTSVITFSIPNLFVILLVLMRGFIPRHEYKRPLIWYSYIPYNSPDKIREISYYPDNNFTKSLIEYSSSRFHYKPFDSVVELEKYISISDEDKCGIEFSPDSSPSHLSYSIKFKTIEPWETNHLFPFVLHTDVRNYDSHADPPPYFKSGFIQVQSTIDNAFIAMTCNGAIDMEKYFNTFHPKLRRMPFPPNVDDKFIEKMDTNITFFLIISFSLQISVIVRNIIYEKKEGLKELFSIYGTSNLSYWIAWLFVYTIYYILSYLVFTTLLALDLTSNGPIMRQSNPFAVFLVFCLNVTSMVSFGLFISTLFNSATFGGNLTGVIIFSMNILISIYETYKDYIPTSIKIFLSFIPPINLFNFIHNIAGFESSMVGLQWHLFNVPVVPGDSLSLSICSIIAGLSIAAYFFLAFYLSQVRPGEHGNPKPWHFPISDIFQKCCNQNLDMDTCQGLVAAYANDQFYENDSPSLEAKIEIINLSKSYNGKSKAVSGINLRIYEGQITVLLGHNGAGKTTTLSMITGFLQATSGQVKIYGHDITKETEKARKQIGFCPQHNVLLSQLTVYEHLWLFAHMKSSLSRSEVEEEIDKTLEELRMSEKRNWNVNHLSGGYKRRLCMGIALICNSKAVILDEPTSGLDPEARRQIIDILHKARKDRTIFVTTHFLDEADYLADKIAILKKGNIVCYGTPLYLKSQFGDGYNLTFVKAEDCNSDDIVSLVRKHIPNARIISNLGDELTICLDTKYRSIFPDLFDEIEENKESHGILSFGISITELEEIFFKFAEDVETDGKLEEKENFTEIKETEEPDDLIDFCEKENDEEPSCFKETVKQLSALFIKRFLHFIRNPFLTLSQILGPFIFVMIAIFLNRYIAQFTDVATTPLKLSVGSYASLGDITVTTHYKSTKEVSPQKLADFQLVLDAFENQLQTIENVEIVNFTNHTQNYIDLLLETSKNQTQRIYTTKYLFGMEVALEDESPDQYEIVGAFMGESLHGQPIAMNALSNTILNHITKKYSANEKLICPKMNDSLRKKAPSIQTFNHPLEMSEEEVIKRISSINMLFRKISGSFPFYINLLVGFSYLVSSQMISLVDEIQTNSKHLQFISGVKFHIYWLTNFLFDYTWFWLNSCIAIILFLVFKADDYAEHPCILLILFTLFGLAILPQNYLLSKFFTNSSSATIFLTSYNIVTAVCGLFLHIVIVKFGNWTLGFQIVNFCKVLFPSFNFSDGVLRIYFNSKFKKICDNPLVVISCLFNPHNPCCLSTCKELCAFWSNNYFEWGGNGIGSHCTALCLQSVFFSFLILFLDSSKSNSFINKVTNKFAKFQFRLLSLKLAIRSFFVRCYEKMKGNEARLEINAEPSPSSRDLSEQSLLDKQIDIDVKRQRAHVEAITSAECSIPDMSLIIKNVSKIYRKHQLFLTEKSLKTRYAVKNLFLSVKSGECFGLLGVNGAGKTTTFKMITGDIDPSSGDILIDNINQKDDMRKAQRKLGYCPQFDVVFGYMTGKENLQFFGKLKNIKQNELVRESEQLFSWLGLKGHENKRASQYSGGMKRKLSLAVSLIGKNPLICLDEPTSGVDPASRRLVWRVILKYLKKGKTIILTSHSMEECEALCSRLCIMVNGEMKCLGSCQHLKNRFGRGYTVSLKTLTPPQVEDETGYKIKVNESISEFFSSQFPNSKLIESCENILKYSIPMNGQQNYKLSHIFRKIEENQAYLHLENFTINQTTLEHVFIDFARKNYED